MAANDPWRQTSPSELAQFVRTDLPDTLRLPAYINRLELLTNEGPLGVIEQLYKVVVKREITYDPAPFNPRPGIEQSIRSAQTILDEQRATCLDLAVLLAGMCLANDLLPLIIVVEGHAFLAVDLQHTRRDSDQSSGFKDGVLTNLRILQGWADDSQYLFLECTGVARSQTNLSAVFPEGKGRNAKGLMSFERACEAGNEQVLHHMSPANATPGANQRPFRYALHIHNLQTTSGFAPNQKSDSASTVPAQTHNQTIGDNARVGTAVSGNVSGGINAGTTIMGDNVGGDKIQGDKIQGDKIVNYAAPEPGSTAQADITKLLTQHKRRLFQLELQQARKGINADPEIIIEIEDIQKEIARLGELLP